MNLFVREVRVEWRSSHSYYISACRLLYVLSTSQTWINL